MYTYVYIYIYIYIYILSHYLCIDPVTHTPEVYLSQPLHWTTARSVKRKRSDDSESTKMDRTETEINHTTQLGKEISTDSEYKVHEVSC